ncbi:MAG: choice-of-anchor L domain-containing protein [Saprospirales bacterium]|nr:choice-of-anchor L domain-containing protein [Saprospirales bacterium]
MKLTVQSIRLILFISLGFAGPAILMGQPLEVTDGATNPYTPQNLITNVFLGEGVEVLDVQYFGVNTAVGFFKNGEDEIGIDRGLVMTTGAAANNGTTLGVTNPGSTFASSSNGSTVTDPDLAMIATGGIFNGAKYLITFIPTADTLRFNYVFGSEEYPEYACTSFNDVFGFFISGPGINGPFENNGMNIALIPGTAQNVSINNLHPQNGANCPPVNVQYYNNNNGMATMPVYDGFTDVFTAEAVVVPCEVYTIKLTISDVGDPIFDTGVFLEAKSFGTGSLDVDIATLSLDGTITEDCSDAVITFSLPTPTESDFPIDFNLFGTATNGIDYTTIPIDLFIPAGDSTVSVPIHAFNDGIFEGLEFIGIDVQRDVCNRDTFYINIRENELIPPELGPDQLICQLDVLQLDGTINIPLPPRLRLPIKIISP